ncbi:MAG: PTS sugar transporter subunit IIA [Planctomycetota bacterium]|nr:PTS sugar transporter subunit IIA [Planctomycetota bacterium]
MKLSELLVPDLIILPMEASDKWEAISTLAVRPFEKGIYSEDMASEVEAALVRRERSMTTGMEQGIAVPHAAVAGLSELIVVLGISRRGIPFDAFDGEPTRIIAGMAIPRAQKLRNIKTLAEVAKLLSQESVRERILASETAEEVLVAIGGGGG